MTETLVFDSLTYIPIKDAAAGLRLSTEYLARLARANRIRTRMVAGMWFLEMHSLQQYLTSTSTRTVIIEAPHRSVNPPQSSPPTPPHQAQRK
jgi:hypothetical protein